MLKNNIDSPLKDNIDPLRNDIVAKLFGKNQFE
jgi:hypothetical protein